MRWVLNTYTPGSEQPSCLASTECLGKSCGRNLCPPQGKMIDRYFVRLGCSQACPAGTAEEVMRLGERRGTGGGAWDGNIRRQCN